MDINGKGEAEMDYTYSCPYCGEILSVSKPGMPWNYCFSCAIEIENPLQSKYETQHYVDIAENIFPPNVYVDGNSGRFRWREILLEETSQNPLFDKEKCEKRIKRNLSSSNSFDLVQRQKESKTQPKCPTCGSTNIKKISTASKIVGASLLGLLSKTANSQFKCNNCGYKW